MTTNSVPSDFSYQDFRDSFLTILEGLVNHNGLNIADEGHYRAMMTNVTGMALQAERALAAIRPGECSGEALKRASAFQLDREVFSDPGLEATIEGGGGL